MATGGREEDRELLASMAKVETKEGTTTETKMKVDSETKAETQTDKMLEKKGMSSTTTLKEEDNEKFKNGDFDGSLSCYTQALEISEIKETEKAIIFKNRAMCRLKVDAFEEAVSDATKALEITPNDPKALYRRCTAYERLGKVEDAFRDAGMLIKVDPKNPAVKPILNRLISIIRQKQETNTKVETKTKAETMAKIETMAKVETKEGTKTETKVKVDSETKAETQTDKMLEKKGEDVLIHNLSMATGGREEEGEEWASQLLSQLCEDVGFSEDEWRLRLWKCDVWSTSQNYGCPIFKALHSGSYSEGLAADILGSDTDIMCVPFGIKVTESDVDSADEEDDVYKAITSNHPAFYMMNPRHAGKGLRGFTSLLRQCWETDPHSKMIVLNGTRVNAISTVPSCDVNTQSVQHGPALTVSRKGEVQGEIDLVKSLHCPSWPTVSEEWKHRLKLSGWPSPELVERVAKLGCEFVATGNPLSLHNDIEWRLSSSAAERVLVRSFNIVQIQSYFLLKLVLVYLIKPCVPESLCSYHMKNIMLWQVEKTDTWTWRRDNLAQCFNECMKVLYQSLKNGNLPQYFIPQQNLFDPKIQGEVRKKLINVVGGLVKEGWVCLLRCIPFTNIQIGCMHEVSRCPCYIRGMGRHTHLRKVRTVQSALGIIAQLSMESIFLVTQYNFDQTVSKMCQAIQRNTVTDEIYRPSRQHIDILNTAMLNHMGYMMLTLTLGPHGQKNAQMYQILQSAKSQLEHNCDVDLSSYHLKLATFYYRLGQVHKCIRIVHDVLEKFTTRTVVLAGDSIRTRYMHSSRDDQHFSGLLPISDDLLRNVSFPVQFSPWEIINAPPAVQGLSFHRRFKSDTDRDNYTVLAIDSLVYAYYLMTISYREVGRPVQAERSLNYLRRMLCRPRHYQVCYPYEAHQLLDHCTRPQRHQSTSGISTLTTC